MSYTRVFAVSVGVLLCLSSTTASAQSTSLVNLMLDTFNRSIVIAPNTQGNGIVQHTAVFAQDSRLVQTQQLVNGVSQQIGSQVSTFVPLGSSSGGFTYGFDATLGTFRRTTQTFGPAFAERAATNGKGRLSVGMNFVHASYNSLDGQNLEDGSIKFNLFHQRLNPENFVEGDVIQAGLAMKLSSSTAAFLLNYGVTDRFDLGVVVPIVRVNMDLTYQAKILDFSTAGVTPSPHVFSDGTKARNFTAAGNASGVGDVVVRAKYGLLDRAGQGLAAGLDLRLPSGDASNMLGTGGTQTKLFLIASGVVAERLSPHFNVGYTVSSHGVSDEFNYVGGFEFGATPRVTIVGDLIGRNLRDTLRISPATVSHGYHQGSLLAPLQTTTLDTVNVAAGSLNSGLGAVGVKVSPAANLLISAHILFGLNEAGLRSRPAPVIGVDYSF